jgi:hypothetical protein
MRLDEFRELENLIRRQFEEIGLPELGAEELYFIRDGDGDLLRRPDAKTLTVEMLKAFDRYLATQDQRTYQESLGIIRQSISEGPSPDRAVVLPPLETDLGVLPDSPPQELADAPVLDSIRDDVRHLIREILETPIDEFGTET